MQIRMPGDKSVSHRALMLAALADGTSKLTNLSRGIDVASTRRCLEQCGIPIRDEGDQVIVEGQGGVFQSPSDDLDAGNAGTTARLITGLLAGRGIEARITGDDSLSRRPMNRITDPLQQMGANIRPTLRGTLPITLLPAALDSLKYEMPIASAQVKSSLLLAGMASEGKVIITEPIPSRNHTELMLEALGVNIETSGDQIILGPGKQSVSSFEFEIPGDPSSVAFVVALALMLPDFETTFEDILLNPYRMGFIKTVQKMGADITWESKHKALGEEVGSITVRSSELQSIKISGSEIPTLIDEIPILAILASRAHGATVIRDAGELRVKESDRIKTVCENLKRMGVRVQELADGFRIWGPANLREARIRTYGDHRIAMAFAVAGRIAAGTTTLDYPESVEISFPDFFDVIKQISP
ncbi:3-phosphoshikimate 1-carboxyvinyltransferase [Candidatus Neomarinimicrobiota bacterium]